MALAAVAMLAAGLRSAQGANSASYTDPTGDYQGGSPDITGASISNNDSGVVTVVIQFAAGRPLVSGMNAGVYFDTDNNQGSGSPTGSEYEIEVDVGANSWAYYRWNGSAWEHLTSSTGSVNFNSTSATFTINRSELANTSRLNFWVFGNWAANDATDYDFAPGSGAFGPYDVTLAPPATTTTAPATTTSVAPPVSTTTTPATTTTAPIVTPAGGTARVDTDKDGVIDTSDKCPKTRGGSYDKNKNGCPGPFSAIRVPSADDLRPSVSSGGITRYMTPRNAIKRLAPGTQLLLRYGSERERLTADKTGTAKSQLLLRNGFRNNSQVEIWAWKPGWIGFAVRLVVRTSSPFAVVGNRRCIAATASTPRACSQVSRGR